MIDKIEIRDLNVFAYHGCGSDEKEKGQVFKINAVLFLDLYDVMLSDDINDTVNYIEVIKRIKDLMLEQKHNTIEHVGSVIARTLLIEFPRLLKITITISKPEIAALVGAGDIFTSVTYSWHDVYLSYGSNIGDSEKILTAAINDIKENKYIRLIKNSSHIKTEPYGNTSQPDFINGCCRIKTIYPPQELLHFLQKIELKYGRERNIKWGARTLDLDILFYDDNIIEEENLIIPHVDIENRMFVLKPMLEINRYFFHPAKRETIEEMYNKLKKNN